jgi:hypothetical protein
MFDLGSVPWAVEAAADSGVISASTRAERINMARAALAAFLSARGPCPTCEGTCEVRWFSAPRIEPCPDCLGSPGSGPSIAEKLTPPSRLPRSNGPRCPVCDRLNIDDQPCRECRERRAKSESDTARFLQCPDCGALSAETKMLAPDETVAACHDEAVLLLRRVVEADDQSVAALADALDEVRRYLRKQPTEGAGT